MRLVDYYEKHKIIPVVNLKDINQKILFEQRDNFYESLNVLNIANKDILELCPGTGINAFYLLSKGINSIHLVDLNSNSIKQCKINLKKFKKKTKIIKDDIYKFNINKKFDIIIIENVLAGMKNPKFILKKYLKNLKKNGLIVFTITDNYSYFSEKLRGLISKLIIEKNDIQIKKYKEIPFEKKLLILIKLFKSHLETLGKNTRNIKKWVLDNMLQFDWWGKDSYFSLIDALQPINFKNNGIVFWSMSPKIEKNYLWYKYRDTKSVNDSILKNYIDNQLNFLDIRQKYDLNLLKATNTKNIKKIIGKTCYLINKLSKKHSIQKKNIKEIISMIKKLNRLLLTLDKSNLTVLSLRSLVNFLQNYLRTDKFNVSLLKGFKSWWGHGTMQVALKKK